MDDNRIISVDATEHAQDSYTEYGIYVNSTRALPSVYDGLKLVQRRLIYSCNQFPNGKIIKSAKLVGNALTYHPHGSDSLYGSLVGLACPINNLPLFDLQGNFGGYNCGASADRYTGASLSKLAKFIYCQFIDYAPMIEGEIDEMEPEYLPSLLPYSLVEGTSGIGIGLSSDIMPLNVMDLIDYYIYYIKNNEFKTDSPLFDLRSSIIDANRNEYNEIVNNYKGSVAVQPVVKQESENIFVIESLPTMKIDKVLKKLSKYIDSEQVDFRDETKSEERYVFEIVDRQSVDTDIFFDDLKKSCSRRLSFNRVFDKDGVSLYCGINYVISNQLKMLNIAIDNKLQVEKDSLLHKSRLLIALKFLKKHGYFNKITKVSTSEQIEIMLKASDKIDIDESLAKEIVLKPISYLTTSHDKELEDIESQINILNNHNRQEYLLDLYKQLKSMIKDLYNSRRHTVLSSELISNPKASLETVEGSPTIKISGKGKGVPFDKYLFLIGENGGLYRRAISVTNECNVGTNVTDENIIAICSDRTRYIEIIANDNTGICYDENNYKYDKRVVKLDSDQIITEAYGYTEKDVPNSIKELVRSRACKTMKYRRS